MAFYSKEVLEKLPKSLLAEIMNDPAKFALFAFDEWAYSKQREIFQKLLKCKRLAVYSANATGKSKSTSWLVVWFAIRFRPSITVLTGPTYEQVLRVLWKNIEELYYKSRIVLGGEFLKREWRIQAGQHYVAPVSPQNTEAMQGIHGENLLFVFDEATRVPNEIWEAVEGNLAGSSNGYWLAIGNPIRRDNRFYETLFDPTFCKMKITAFDTPLFTGEIDLIPEKYAKVLRKVLINPEAVETIKRRYGENSAVYKSRVLAEFPDEEGGNAVFDLSLIRKAFTQPGKKGSPRVITVDVARYGDDSSVIALWDNFVCTDLIEFKKNSLTSLASKIIEIYKKENYNYVIVDAHGLGQGVIDILAEENVEVIGANYQRKAFESDKYADRRSEMYFGLREAIAEGLVHLPESRRLEIDLLSIEYTFDKAGRIKILDKDKIRKKIRRSPDFAEAVALRFYTRLAEDENDDLVVFSF